MTILGTRRRNTGSSVGSISTTVALRSTATTTTNAPRSTTMLTVHEALARERIREREQRSRQDRLAGELAAQRRWHRVSRYARTAESRHAARVTQAATR